MVKSILIVLMAIFLSSCATITPRVQTPTNNWVVQGKMGLQSPKSSGSAYFHWQQIGEDYQIKLFGPLGMGAVELNGSPDKVNFTNNKGQVYQADSPELLLKQNTGWQIPVENLMYWIRGLPAPDWRSEKTYNSQHQLALLKQQGWQVAYLKYQNGLPKLIQLDYSQIKLRISIDTITYS